MIAEYVRRMATYDLNGCALARPFGFTAAHGHAKSSHTTHAAERRAFIITAVAAKAKSHAAKSTHTAKELSENIFGATGLEAAARAEGETSGQTAATTNVHVVTSWNTWKIKPKQVQCSERASECKTRKQLHCSE